MKSWICPHCFRRDNTGHEIIINICHCGYEMQDELQIITEQTKQIGLKKDGRTN